LRFDFSHFSKVSDEEMEQIQAKIDEMILNNLPLNEKRNVPIDEAQNMGAMALFGEKYGDTVRVIQFGDSIELCGGTHTQNTGKIGLFKITSESVVAAGVRRIEAITGPTAESYFRDCDAQIAELKSLLKATKDVKSAVESLMNKNQALQEEVEQLKKAQAQAVKQDLKAKITEVNGVNLLTTEVNLDAGSIKDILFQFRGEYQNFVGLGGGIDGDKCSLNVMIADNLVKDKNWHAGNFVKQAAKHIQGGGGGQPFFATAGGRNAQGLPTALEEIQGLLV
jgi:alanyl-tRNA synthetase